MNLKERQWIIGGLFLLIALIFIGRLAQLQLLSSNLQDYAARLTQEREVLAPARGLEVPPVRAGQPRGPLAHS